MRVRSLLVALGAVALASACSEGKPSGFGVNVTVNTEQVKAQVVRFGLHVTGAETFDSTFDVAQAAPKGEVRFRYVPGVKDGTIFIAVDGLDAAGAFVGRGATPGVVLVPGAAVDASLTLSSGLGLPCKTAGECPSGYCVDGVCCDSACDGTCETCALTGMLGKCAPIPADTDPEMECGNKPLKLEDDAGTAPPDDGGAPPDDGGAPPGRRLNPPDGGIEVTPQKCAGSCSGNRSCTYAKKAGETCGMPELFCNSATESARFACDDTGACVPAFTACTDYVCGAGACKSMCTANADCQDHDYCNLNTNRCVIKKDDGAACANATECKSGVCVGTLPNGICCNTACGGVGQTCTDPGSLGKCKCQGVTCAAGVACQIFYADTDNDGYGDPSSSKPGCEGAPPAGFVANKADCDDKDSRAHPGQIGYFTTPRTTGGGYDFNCDGNTEKEIVRAGATCTFCTFINNGGLIGCGTSSTCSTAGTGSALACGATPKGLGGVCLCCAQATAGFVVDTACGSSAPNNYRTCGSCGVAGGSSSSNLSTRTMGCR